MSTFLKPRHAFMTGSGKLLSGDAAGRFTQAIMRSLMDGEAGGEVGSQAAFAMGFAACVDAVARGTFDADSDPIETCRLAWEDVNDVSPRDKNVADVFDWTKSK